LGARGGKIAAGGCGREKNQGGGSHVQGSPVKLTTVQGRCKGRWGGGSKKKIGEQTKVVYVKRMEGVTLLSERYRRGDEHAKKGGGLQDKYNWDHVRRF